MRIVCLGVDRFVVDLLREKLRNHSLEAVDPAALEARIERSHPDLLLADLTSNGVRDCLPEDGARPKTVALNDAAELIEADRESGIIIAGDYPNLEALMADLGVDLVSDSPESEQGVRGHVLMADDDPAARELLSAALEQSGYRVTVVADGDEAIDAIARDESIQVALLDISMPNRGGLDTLRDIGKIRAIPVIMTTAILDREVAQRSLELGAFDYILKPLDLNEVETAISSALAEAEDRKRGFLSRWLS